MFSTTWPIVRNHIEAVLLTVMDEILDVVIARVTGDPWHNAEASESQESVRECKMQ